MCGATKCAEQMESQCKTNATTEILLNIHKNVRYNWDPDTTENGPSIVCYFMRIFVRSDRDTLVYQLSRSPDFGSLTTLGAT